MRLILKLKSNKDVLQNKENNSKFYTGMHGWLYGKLNGTDFSDVYEQKDFKPFCFSNLFEISNERIEENKNYSLIISSPNEMFMIVLLSKINISEEINFGEYSFELMNYKPLGKKGIEIGDILESETIVNICLNENGKRRAITLFKNPDLFKIQLSRNLIRKYNQYHEEKIEEDFDLFDNTNFEEIDDSESAIRINLIKNSDNWFNVIGSRYKFNIGKINETQIKILQFCYDLGFGERNSFGFGFMNLKNKNVN
jgi:CRISPR-associated endoribonuclease Cas6